MTFTDQKPAEMRTGDPQPGTPCFLGRPIDDVPQLLELSYRLRYQVYCLERKFLRVEDYPDGLEIDEYDRHSVHVGAIDAHGDLAGTARAVKVSELGLPLFDHCTTFPNETQFHAANPRLVEVSRLSVSRSYSRRGSDVSRGVENASRSGQTAEYRGTERRGRCDDVLLTVLKAVYQETKRIGATHWLVAIQKSLQRLLAQHGFPFRLIGPESDYFGLVAPYQMDLKEFDEVIKSRRFPGLDEFVVGPEPRVRPQPKDAGIVSPVQTTDRVVRQARR
jgi:N-acyl amino acid synthase of PEP-CTERM/exosortase system